MLRALAAIALVAAVTACAKTQPRHQTIVLSDLVGRGTSIAETLKESCAGLQSKNHSFMLFLSQRSPRAPVGNDSTTSAESRRLFLKRVAVDCYKVSSA